MKERPVIFTGKSVRGILEGRKTETRRVVKRSCDTVGKDVAEEFTKEAYAHGFTCPYGEPGDRLWVRETFTLQSECAGDDPPFTDGRPIKRFDDDEFAPCAWLQPHYKASDRTPELCCERENCKCQDGEPCCHWKPSIHMPRWASRLTLEIRKVRVERVQEISEADAAAEGADADYFARYMTGEMPQPSFVEGFKVLWNLVNAKRGFGWDVNPWVWVIEFRKADQ